MKKYIITVFVIFSFLTTKAQLVNLCGTDTILLQVDNYKNGVIEWQESIDTISWATIPEVSGITYKFFPTQTKYYRAVVKTSTCDPLYSSITLVQLPPVSNAGTDRIVGDTIVTLLGNKVTGASGEWKTISGIGGKILSSENQNSKFTGNYNQNYLLVWTITNTCGQKSDTVSIKFEEIKSKNNFIVIDNTDQILSDSTELANGIYKIIFSDSTIAPYDSVMLIGIRDSLSFLRKVNSFNFQDSVYIFNTVQGSFEDLFQSGVLNIGDAVNQSIIQGTKKSAMLLPTRNTIKANANNKGLLLLYSKTVYNDNHSTLKSLKNTNGSNGLTISLPDVDIFKTNDGGFKLSIEDSYIRIDPNFVLDFKYSFPATLTSLRLGLDNAQFEYNYKTKIEASSSINFVDADKTITKVTSYILIQAGPVPIVVTANFEIKASCNIGISAGVLIEEKKDYIKNITAMVAGNNTQNLSLVTNSTETSTHEENFALQGTMTSEFKLGPEISFKVYDFVGPYFNLPLKAELGICANTDRNWDANATLSVEGNLGAKAKILGLTLFDFNYDIFNGLYLNTIKMPYQLELLSGNFQSGKSGEKLPNLINCKVTSNLGFAVPFVPVKFELENGNGSVPDKVSYTDIFGLVSEAWTLGVNAENKLKVSVLDCDNQDIENSPMFVYASSSNAPYNCTNSDLNISLKTNQTYSYPFVTGGTVPYLYSLNGIDYSSQTPQFKSSSPGNYTVYVKDKNQCKVERSFTINVPDKCKNSNLNLDILTQANTLQLSGKNGIPPYQFSVDNQNNFSVNNLYNNLTTGNHNVYIKDASNCVALNTVKIEKQSIALIAIQPVDSAKYVELISLVFKWQAGTYAMNQVYDLYLKKGNEAYTLIASNLTIPNYTFNSQLTNDTSYTWKVVVKDQNGIQKDFREFTFTTASNNSSTPIIPKLLQPANDTTVYGLPVTLRWQLQSGDFKYDLYLDTLNATKLIANNLNNNEYVLNKLIIGKKYYWKVKIKSLVSGENKQSYVWHFIPNQTSVTTVSDIDGNFYKTVKIGTQLWMAENLKTTKYNDGTAIPNVTDGTAWGGLSTPAYCWYNNDATTYKATYGALYNWYVVKTGKLCPTGWHVHTDAEWTTLTTFLGGESVAGGKLKETGTTHWQSPNTGATNETGFTALPGGYRNLGGGAFSWVGLGGYWWGSSEIGAGSAWFRSVYYYGSVAYHSLNAEGYGYSVRCVKNDTILQVLLPSLTTNGISNITQTTAVSGGKITSDGGASITARGICWSTNQNATTADNKTTDSSGIGNFTSSLTGLITNTTYYVRAFATNSSGTGYGNEISFKTLSDTSSETVTDVDGNVYKTVTIGTQVWMAENLKTTTYNNGTTIPNVTDGTTWAALITPAYCWYNNDASTNKATYGTLYNWYTVNTSMLCPTGWHVPTDDEWTTLTTFLGGESIAGGKLKEIGTTHWSSPNIGADNSSGFTALPGGYRNYDGNFITNGNYGVWWSSSESSTSNAWYRDMIYGYSIVERSSYKELDGFSVRCLRD
jgi:uncharacterized protein (TIGR02145 family)